MINPQKHLKSIVVVVIGNFDFSDGHLLCPNRVFQSSSANDKTALVLRIVFCTTESTFIVRNTNLIDKQGKKCLY